MATFERIDPDGDLNTGRSVFAEAFSMSLTAYDVRSAKQEADWWDWESMPTMKTC